MNSLLHEAIKKYINNQENDKIIKFLLKNNAIIDIQNSEGVTPFFIASVFNLKSIVDLLLENNADINLTVVKKVF